MSGSLRYKDPIICEYLASQYVMSVMTPLVRARIERLRRHVPELDDAIIGWSERMAKINVNFPEKQPSVQVWKRIESVIVPPLKKANDHQKSPSSMWGSLPFWRWMGIGASITSCTLAFVLTTGITIQNPVVPSISGTPSYTAVMSPVREGENNIENIRFVVNVYQKTENEPSRLFIQWSERKPRLNMVTMHVWAENQTTRELTYIGMEKQGVKSLSLNKVTWDAVTNSSHLYFTKDTNKPSAVNTLFSGPCIQLESWKADSV